MAAAVAEPAPAAQLTPPAAPLPHAADPPQPAASSDPSDGALARLQASARARAAAAGVAPRIFSRARSADEAAAEGIVPEWGNLQRGIRLPQHMLRSLAGVPLKREPGAPGAPGLASSGEGAAPRAKAGGRCPKPGGGRTFTSRFRGVHQTFPTRRWEAQFRRNGKPTSLGCFDREEDAAAAYDRMMLWLEMHGGGGSKGGVTNFDVSRYAGDLAWLASISQDALIEALRTEGRRQASNRARPAAAAATAARGGSTTPEPDSDWAEGSGSDEDGARRKRRRAAARPSARSQQDVAGEAAAAAVAAALAASQPDGDGSAQLLLLPGAGVGVPPDPTEGAADLPQPLQFDSSALNALRAAQEAVAAAAHAALAAQAEEQQQLQQQQELSGQQQQSGS
ncbi:AP2-like ethylene-responsive transcription factor [Raphidocelis subcapitata]|uniref:AP2-like ethylene-responsive transcription factor n=1 Tax=Raphidocelis subcapitata TaxID=307507 RepID=A0A2V0PDV0_9CHLO|nr:AP2-like ethylene-responsive transcription factor [Raphidocelis subcapitata]|eukprot:GBF96070.1 AP2-like ethylene-responsive transcription factor [Raphidocelis subcapitata]